jgi:hypothetical protein
MRKKIIIILILAAFFTGNLFAQEDENEDEEKEKSAKNRISLSIGIVGAELSYERIFSPYLSVLGQVSYNNIIFADSLSFAVKGRWYPLGEVFYLDLGLGYSLGYNHIFFSSLSEFHSFYMSPLGSLITIFAIALAPVLLNAVVPLGIITAFETPKDEGGFYLQPGIGWNVDIGKRFMLPISMGVDMRFSEKIAVLPYLRIGFGFSF